MINETAAIGEQVITVVRPEGSKIPPMDVRCQALNLKGNRCKKSICYAEDTWMKFCEIHYEQNEQARQGNGRKVKVYYG